MRKQFLGDHFLHETCTKLSIIYACTSMYFNLIPQKSAQDPIQELCFKAESPITSVQASNSLYFKLFQLLRVSHTETSAVIHFDFYFLENTTEKCLKNNYLLVFDILFLFFSMRVFSKHHKHYHYHCMTEKSWYKHTQETPMGQSANH